MYSYVRISELCYYVLDFRGEMQNIAMVQYTFTGTEHAINVKKHGRAKENNPYCRTFPSTMHALKEESVSKMPKRDVHVISEAKGGILKADGAGA